jgi:acetyl-CoA synthetase (ADP-forming)
VSFRVCPISKKDAQDMISETKFSKVLMGYRGARSDIDALVEILIKTSKLLMDNQEIVELDINPVVALPKGAIAADARIVID